MKPSDVLRQALGDLATHGWARFEMRRRDGSVCLLGAVNGTARGYLPYHLASGAVDRAYVYLSRAILVQTHFTVHTPSDMTAWNDHIPADRCAVMRVVALAAATAQKEGE